jgi:hypothetical protein
MNDGKRIEDAGGIINIGDECFGLADGSVLSWRGENYVPQKPSLIVRLSNWRNRCRNKLVHEN